MRQIKMVANGKLHSLQKIIFFSWWRLGNTIFALWEYRAFSQSNALLIPVILFIVLLF